MPPRRAAPQDIIQAGHPLWDDVPLLFDDAKHSTHGAQGGGVKGGVGQREVLLVVLPEQEGGLVAQGAQALGNGLQKGVGVSQWSQFPDLGVKSGEVLGQPWLAWVKRYGWGEFPCRPALGRLMVGQGKR